MWWLLLFGLARAAPAPSDATVVYYNARMALREGHALESIKLWLLRNTMVNRSGQISSQDDDFRSVTWAALGELGICQDGAPTDTEGAGLWPLALHNSVVRNLGRGKPPKKIRPFDAFEVGRQQRFVSITDVLSAPELTTLHLSRSRCLRPRIALIESGEKITAKLTDRQVAARLLRHLLERAKSTLVEGRIRGRAVIEARLFDIDLQLTELAAREARAEARERSRTGREAGLSRAARTALRADAPVSTLDPYSPAGRVMRACVGWPAEEWLALAPEQRLFLFTRARAFNKDPKTFDALGFEILDSLIAAGEGEAAEQWIAQLVAEGAAAPDRARVWGGDRGQARLALDDASGFQERSVVATYRGIDQLARGELADALRSLAFAREHAAESRSASIIEPLSLRWMSYVASRFAISPALLLTLQELVPRRDYGVILEDLMWSAAFHSDGASFEDGLAHQVGRGALERRLRLLQPLAGGDVARFINGIQRGLTESPSETLRFLDQLVQRLEREDAGVRAAQLPTLVHLRRLLAPLAEAAEASGHQGRMATSLMDRTQAIGEGLGGLPGEASLRDRAHALSPNAEVFAGSIRLAPADPLPWPFLPIDPAAPSIFSPISLIPLEWRDEAGALVYGWSIRG